MLLWSILGVSLTALSASAACLWTSCRLNATVALDREDLFELVRVFGNDHDDFVKMVKQHRADVALFVAQRDGIKPVITLHRPEAGGLA